MDRRIISRQKVVIILLLILIIVLIGFVYYFKYQNSRLNETIASQNIEMDNMQEYISSINISGEKKKNLGWELVLVNSSNKIPDDYEFELEYIDTTRQFDSRAINYLKDMLHDAKRDNITNFWAQSTYRTVELQEKLFNQKVNEYKRLGYSETISKILTERSINKPGYSEHNLGLCVDFNNVDNAFEKTKAYTWLMENAENYGFVLRYPEEKADITGVKYEPWHWRYVGIEHAKEMNKLNMCLEEYVEYLMGES